MSTSESGMVHGEMHRITIWVHEYALSYDRLNSVASYPHEFYVILISAHFSSQRSSRSSELGSNSTRIKPLSSESTSHRTASYL